MIKGKGNVFTAYASSGKGMVKANNDLFSRDAVLYTDSLDGESPVRARVEL